MVLQYLRHHFDLVWGCLKCNYRILFVNELQDEPASGMTSEAEHVYYQIHKHAEPDIVVTQNAIYFLFPNCQAHRGSGRVMRLSAQWKRIMVPNKANNNCPQKWTKMKSHHILRRAHGRLSPKIGPNVQESTKYVSTGFGNAENLKMLKICFVVDYF